jgi:hypothetical protein
MQISGSNQWIAQPKFNSKAMKKQEHVNYTNFNCQEDGSTLIQGIRGVNGSEKVYIAGTFTESSSLAYGLLYEGPLFLNGNEGEWHKLTFTAEGVDDVVNTSCYGPNNLDNGNVQIVGSYKVASSPDTKGFYYEGPVDGSGTWKTVSPNNGDSKMVFVHSTMGGYAVGNYDTEVYNAYAFIYNIATEEFQEIAVDGAHSTTLYGIWHNGGTSYTLVGGCSFDGPENLSQAFIVDWDSETQETSNWSMYQYLDENVKSLVTHFEGITTDGEGGYNIPCDWVAFDKKDSTPLETSGAFVNIKRNTDGTFASPTWVPLKFPVNGAMTSANTAYKNNILGVYFMPNNNGGMYTISYNAKVLPSC